MVEWLENGENKPSDLKAWVVEKPVYILMDLQKSADNRTLAEKENKNKEEKSKGKKMMKDACLSEEFGKGSKVIDKGSFKKKNTILKKLQK